MTKLPTSKITKIDLLQKPLNNLINKWQNKLDNIYQQITELRSQGYYLDIPRLDEIKFEREEFLDDLERLKKMSEVKNNE